MTGYQRAALLLVVLWLALGAALQALGDTPVRRGSRCPDSACAAVEKARWDAEMARAEGQMAAATAKMLATWVEAGYAERVIERRYARLHDRYLRRVRIATDRYYFEVQGYSLEASRRAADEIVAYSEEKLIGSVVQTWPDVTRGMRR